MAALIETKERLGSTRDTHKITKSLQLVAASRMKYYQKKAVAVRTFSEEILQQMRLAGSSSFDDRFTKGNTNGKRLFVIITSNKGLCGNLNQRVLKQLFTSAVWQQTSEEDRAVITIGKKSTDAMRRLNIPTIARFPTVLETLDPLGALAVIDKIIKPWEDGLYGEVYLVYPRYISPFVNEPTVKKYLPYEKSLPNTETSAESAQLPVYLEPSPEAVREALWHQFIQMLFVTGFYEMKASEYSSRMIAMKKATDAAQEMIDTLTLELNKARQAKITQELAELAGASLAEEED
jgi:F-type H+-transporting ATPase subunit gamma